MTDNNDDDRYKDNSVYEHYKDNAVGVLLHFEAREDDPALCVSMAMVWAVLALAEAQVRR